jgi:hypothetical protein
MATSKTVAASTSTITTASYQIVDATNTTDPVSYYTFTTSAAHKFVQGMTVAISGATSGSVYNNSFTIDTIVDSYTFIVKNASVTVPTGSPTTATSSNYTTTFDTSGIKLINNVELFINSNKNNPTLATAPSKTEIDFSGFIINQNKTNLTSFNQTNYLLDLDGTTILKTFAQEFLLPQDFARNNRYPKITGIHLNANTDANYKIAYSIDTYNDAYGWKQIFEGTYIGANETSGPKWIQINFASFTIDSEYINQKFRIVVNGLTGVTGFYYSEQSPFEQDSCFVTDPTIVLPYKTNTILDPRGVVNSSLWGTYAGGNTPTKTFNVLDGPENTEITTSFKVQVAPAGTTLTTNVTDSDTASNTSLSITGASSDGTRITYTTSSNPPLSPGQNIISITGFDNNNFNLNNTTVETVKTTLPYNFTVLNTLTTASETKSATAAYGRVYGVPKIISDGYLSVTPGGNFSVSAWFKGDTAVGAIRIIPYFRNANGEWVTLYNGTSVNLTSLNVNKWINLTGTFTVPTNAAYATFQIQWYGLTTSTTYTSQYTGCIMSTDSTPPLFFDGNSVDAIWTGTPNLSKSIIKNKRIKKNKKAVAVRFRLMGDVADDGTDIFGNSYRSSIYKQPAENVIDLNTDTWWMSKANPSKYGVESLYFDLGKKDVVEALFVDPVTPNVNFNIYYIKGDEKPNGISSTDFDSMLWTRVPKQFQATKRQNYVFPTSVYARYFKIEFTSLQAQPYVTGDFQKPILYKKYPQWVFDYFLSIYAFNKNDTYDPFTASKVNVSFDLLQLAFNYYKNDIIQDGMKANDIKTVNESIINLDQTVKNLLLKNQDGVDSLDLTTYSKVKTAFDPFMDHPVNRSTFDSVIAGITLSNANYNNYPIEDKLITVANTGDVSTHNRNHLIQEKTIPHMYFFLDSRHSYREAIAKLQNNKAYFVGIKEIAFQRRDHKIVSNNDMYVISSGDVINSELNTFTLNGESWISK